MINIMKCNQPYDVNKFTLKHNKKLYRLAYELFLDADKRGYTDIDDYLDDEQLITFIHNNQKFCVNDNFVIFITGLDNTVPSGYVYEKDNEMLLVINNKLNNLRWDDLPFFNFLIFNTIYMHKNIHANITLLDTFVNSVIEYMKINTVDVIKIRGYIEYLELLSKPGYEYSPLLQHNCKYMLNKFTPDYILERYFKKFN